MKNLIKPLQWLVNEEEGTIKADTLLPNLQYEMYELDGLWYAYLLADFQNTTEEYIFDGCLESEAAAKAACEKHHIKTVWSALSPDARAILEQHLNK